MDEGAARYPSALRTGIRACTRLLPSLALATLNDHASASREMRRASVATLQELGIEARFDDRSGLSAEDHRRGGCLFVHLDQQTLLSVVLYPLVLPERCSLIVNFEFALLPVIGWLTVLQGAVPIVRQHPRQAKRALASVTRRLREGDNFGISIEGQRSRDGLLSPYKKGAAVLAIEAGATVVPFMTHGEYRLWPHGQSYIRPGVVELVAYPGISTRGLTYADRDDLVTTLRNLALRERRERGLE